MMSPSMVQPTTRVPEVRVGSFRRNMGTDITSSELRQIDSRSAGCKCILDSEYNVLRLFRA